MKEKEGRLAAEAAELLRRAGEVDDEEDRRYGKDKRGDELPEELAFRESRLRKIREAKAALDAGVLAEAEPTGSEGRNHPGVPDDKAQRNFTDPDSRIMPGLQQSYNCRRWWTTPTKVIVAARATNQAAESTRKSAGFANGVIFEKLLGRQRLQPARIVVAEQPVIPGALSSISAAFTLGLRLETTVLTPNPPMDGLGDSP